MSLQRTNTLEKTTAHNHRSINILERSKSASFLTTFSRLILLNVCSFFSLGTEKKHQYLKKKVRLEPPYKNKIWIHKTKLTTGNQFKTNRKSWNKDGCHCNVWLHSAVIHKTFFVVTTELNTYLESAKRDGLETFHLYAANNRISAHELFILYDLRGWIVSFCTVSISRASSSWSKTYNKKLLQQALSTTKWRCTVLMVTLEH